MPRLPLALMTPLCLIFFYLILVVAEYWFERSETQEQIEQTQLTQIRNKMFRLQHVISDAMAVHDIERISQEVSLISTDLDVMVLILVDPASTIRYANYAVWQGSRASQVIDGYDVLRHQQIVSADRPWVEVNPQRLSIQAYYPVNLKGIPRYGNINLIYLEYDLSSAYNRAFGQLEQRFLQVWGGGAILILLFIFVFHVVYVRPLRRLLSLARRGTPDAIARTIDFAPTELAHLQNHLYQKEVRLQKTQKQLCDAELRWLFAIECSQTGIWDWQLKTDEFFLSARWKSMLGYEPEEIASEHLTLERLLHPDDKDQVLEKLRSCINGESDTYESRHRLRHRQGHYIWGHDRGMVVEWQSDGRPARLIGSLLDVSEDVRNQRAVVYQASHDALTNLANRYSIIDALLAFQRGGKDVQVRTGALMLIDLDNFKLINDALGHQHGDRLLIQVASRLASAFSHNALVARLGGDEFGVMLLDLDSDASLATQQAQQLGSTLCQLFGRSFNLANQHINASASVGICLFDNQQRLEASQILKRADMAMYAAKDRGGNGCSFYTDELEVQTAENMWLQNELTHAIERNQLSLVFQPIYNQAGELVCAEALCRWHHPVRGLISPVRFIPAAEESGLIVSIGDWVLSEVCRTIKSMASQGTPMPAVAVNISAHHFNQNDFVERLVSLVKAFDVSPAQIEFELTEHALLSNLTVISERMQRIRMLGFAIAIDDFGTGYSSLSYLQSLPLSRLKLDAAFVAKIGTEAGDAIVRAIVEMAHSLTLQVVAEGVESHAQHQYLQSLGCEYYQGYLFGKPTSALNLVRDGSDELLMA